MASIFSQAPEAERLSSYRKRYGITQRELGRLVGVSDRQVCHWEAGRSRMENGAGVRLLPYLNTYEVFSGFLRKIQAMPTVLLVGGKQPDVQDKFVSRMERMGIRTTYRWDAEVPDYGKRLPKVAAVVVITTVMPAKFLRALRQTGREQGIPIVEVPASWSRAQGILERRVVAGYAPPAPSKMGRKPSKGSKQKGPKVKIRTQPIKPVSRPPKDEARMNTKLLNLIEAPLPIPSGWYTQQDIVGILKGRSNFTDGVRGLLGDHKTFLDPDTGELAEAWPEQKILDLLETLPPPQVVEGEEKSEEPEPVPEQSVEHHVEQTLHLAMTESIRAWSDYRTKAETEKKVGDLERQLSAMTARAESAELEVLKLQETAELLERLKSLVNL